MATRIKVSDFSCIRSADMRLSNLTVLIGPSASGKSVLSKLIFFFNSILTDQFSALEDMTGIDGFKEQIKSRFKDWFPVEAWGQKKFCIEFEAGDFKIRITRIEYRKKPGENIRIWFSPYFEQQYAIAAVYTKAALGEEQLVSNQAFDVLWKVREAIVQNLQRDLGSDFHELQTFIPAGRSFFTSVGKSIAAFEHGRVLDPLILRFGRLYAALRDRNSMHRDQAEVDPEWGSAFDRLLDGKLVSERSREFFQASDGRKIPLSALSSGQQEMVPLVLALRARARTQLVKRYQQLVFIEEPEAHLFPAAQSVLVEQFCVLLNAARGRMRLFVTTHSPYVLAKVNNLIKAHQVGGSKKSRAYAEVDKIVDDRAWIDAANVTAYAMHDGDLIDIQDPFDGLIEGDYLDQISSEMSVEFSKILGVEARK